MSGPPDLPHGYLGAQPKFAELGLSAFSHIEPEIRCNDNQLEIKVKAPKAPEGSQDESAVKVTHQLIDCRSDKDISEYVFTQQLNNVISFLINMPESGYYKFQVFALPAKDDSKSLPNVFNYVINCVRALHPVVPFPKQYAQWKDGCYMHEPLALHKEDRLQNVFWKVRIPKAKAVAVVADGQWFHFEKKGNHWELCNCKLDQFKGKDTKITLNANFGEDESKFSTLLEYRIQ